MEAKSNDNMRLVPILVGVGVVAASAMLAKIILDQRKKVLHHDQTCTELSMGFRSHRELQVKKITLVNPNEKYPLKLVEKVVLSHDTRLFR